VPCRPIHGRPKINALKLVYAAVSHTEKSLSSKLSAHLGAKVNDPTALSAGVVQAFAQFAPPRVGGEVGTTFEYITALNPAAGGQTRKLGNIRLNWRKLFDKAPELVLTGAGVSQPWLVPFAALYAWNLVWSLARIEITPAQAMAMHALWNAGQQSRRFSEAEALSVVNSFRITCREAPQSEAEFAKVINDLVALQCVELSDGVICLREGVEKAN
jgi:hypothetical protein